MPVLVTAALVGCVIALALAGPASAATVAPTINADEYDNSPNATCSLREAVQSANANMNFGGCMATDLPYGTDTIALGDGTYNPDHLRAAEPNAAGNIHISSGST